MTAAPQMGPGLSVRGLTTTFHTRNGPRVAVEAIDLDLAPGEVLGLVGESGSGKSVTLRSLVRLIRPPGVVTGAVYWKARNLLDLDDKNLRKVRGREIAMIFQEPMSALNPVLTIEQQIGQSLAVHTTLSPQQRLARTNELMDMVGIPDPDSRRTDYPFQFSGGMRQRVMIAIALAGSPQILLADEPTTALDVTIQDQILKLILGLRTQLRMSVIFVTHDLGVVAQTCDRVAVMYAGRIVETGTVSAVFASPRHPYTLGLLGSVPRGGRERQPLRSIPGTPPSMAAMPPGCAFHPRCALRTALCMSEIPKLIEAAPERWSACHHQDQLAGLG